MAQKDETSLVFKEASPFRMVSLIFVFLACLQGMGFVRPAPLQGIAVRAGTETRPAKLQAYKRK